MLKLTDDELTHIFQAAAPIRSSAATISSKRSRPSCSAPPVRSVRAPFIGQSRRRSGSTSIRRKTTALQAARDGTATRLVSRRSASRRRAEGRSPDTETNFATQRSVVACRRMPVPVSLFEPHFAGLRREAASSFGSSRLSAASYGGAFSVAVCAMMHWACWSAFAELATKLGEDPIRPGKPALPRRGKRAAWTCT